MARDSIRIFIGIGFLLGFATFYVIPGAILLLIIYTIAIIINLVKGRVDFDCGCGGLVGAHKLSKNLVFRNVLLIFVLIGGFTVQPFSLFAMAFDYKFFLMNSVYILGILVTLTSKEMFDLKQNIKLLTKGNKFGINLGYCLFFTVGYYCRSRLLHL